MNCPRLVGCYNKTDFPCSLGFCAEWKQTFKILKCRSFYICFLVIFSKYLHICFYLLVAQLGYALVYNYSYYRNC